jgi:multiple sugar transport system substrate-binding protein
MSARVTTRGTVAGLLALALITSVSACSNGSSDTDSASGDASTLTLWDPYPQFSDSDAWPQLVAKCGQENGVTIQRTGYDTTDLTNQVLRAAQQSNSPNVLVVDNPVVSTLADGGVLADNGTTGLDASGVQDNVLAAGEVDGKTYGVPIGANTLALYYNKAVLQAAGVDPASITDWASLTSALEKVKGSGKNGITFSAIGTEEGSFQFLPWLWGSGADLTDLTSSDATASLQLWTDWVQQGLAPQTVISNNQQSAWEEFLTGDYGFVENGTWQLGPVKKSGLDWGVIPIPGRDGGTAPAPTGGEFVTLPTQADDSTYGVSAKVVECLTSADNALQTDTTLSYVSALPDVQQQQVGQDADLQPWVEAVSAARGRTADGLGTKYPTISEQLWNAVQAALSGSQSPQAALEAAQQAAGN